MEFKLHEVPPEGAAHTQFLNPVKFVGGFFCLQCLNRLNCVLPLVCSPDRVFCTLCSAVARRELLHAAGSKQRGAQPCHQQLLNFGDDNWMSLFLHQSECKNFRINVASIKNLFKTLSVCFLM